MKVLIKHPNMPPSVELWPYIPLDKLQAVVGGWITTAVSLIADRDPAQGGARKNTGWIGYCDDEGLLKGYEFNFYRPTDNAPIVGPVVFVGVDAEGDNIGLTDAQIEDIRTRIGI